MPSYTVPYSALATEVSLVKAELMQAVESVLDSGRYILGPEVGAFEREFADYCQASYSVGISNGTSALHLVLRAIGIKEGDEVKVADYVGRVGNTGTSTGAHLHLEIHVDGVAVDPFVWLKKYTD